MAEFDLPYYMLWGFGLAAIAVTIFLLLWILLDE